MKKDYSALHTWENYSADIMVEYKQSLEEGKDIEAYRALFEAVNAMPIGEKRARIGEVIFDIVCDAPMREGYAYEEPSDLEAIRAARPAAKNGVKPVNKDEKLKDKVLGAWLGRVCGCLLGKPIEGIHTEDFHPFLKATDNWPMKRYITSADAKKCNYRAGKYGLEDYSLADLLECAPSDDDTNYVVLAQVLVERCGRNFTPRDVANIWTRFQPKHAYCTAERVAYCNFVSGYMPPVSAQYHNPYREWIGAQIRGDYFGYINPGNPELAAEMAWRDASISHIKNGIYGEMFAAAMIAEAAVEDDLEAIIRAGLNEVPEKSRLYELVGSVLDDWHAGKSQAECFDRIHTLWDEHNSHDWCHTISNAMIVAACLLYGEGDYARSICMAVETGFDTDCNGATVGSILGMRNGTAGIGEEWTKPIHGKLDTAIFGVGRVQIADMAEKTMKHMA